VGCSREGKLCLPSDAEPEGGPTSSDPSSPISNPADPAIIPGSGDDDLSPTPEPAPEPDSSEVSIENCRELALSAAGLGTGDAFVDRYFAEVEHVRERTAELSQESISSFAELAAMTGATDATAAAVVDAYPAWEVDTLGSDVRLLMFTPHCPISVSALLGYTEACDPASRGSTERLACQGVCGSSSAAACTDGTLECLSSAATECGGRCEGACDVPLDAEGACFGTCTGTCKTENETCDGGDLTCRSDENASVACDTTCDGELTPPESIAGCSEVARAAAWLSLECVATPPIPWNDGTSDAGVPVESSAFDEFAAATARVLEISDESRRVLQAAALLNAAVATVSSAVEADTTGDAGASNACAAALLTAAPGTLGQAGADIDLVLRNGIAFVTGIQ
jgi:hypothetical protein